MTMNNQKQTQLPWYRDGYVWMIICIPGSAVVMGFFLLYLAIDSYDGLVKDDYYKYGLQINKTLERDEQAKTLGLQANLQLNNESKKFRLILTGNDEFIQPEQLNISFLHSTRAGYDQQILAMQQAEHTYVADLPELIQGKWLIQIETEKWRLLKEMSI